MRNEYLFLSDENRAAVEKYKPDSITVEISDNKKSPLWIVRYSLERKNEDSAKKLSEVHTALMQYSPLVLSCESSEYYNRILFPLVNELECKLRKLLYLAASISDNEEAKENIKQLEKKDFGEIFELLFIDPNFVTGMKIRINAESKSVFNGKSKYSKGEIQDYMDSLDEHVLWDTMLGKEDVPTLRSRFRDVQTYRNDIMHAHHIGKDLFGKARYLFSKINKELDSAIIKLIGTPNGKPSAPKSDVNKAIANAMVAMDLSTVSNAFKAASLTPAVLEVSSQMSKVFEGLQPIGAGTALSDAIKEAQFPTVQLGAIEELKKLASNISSPAVIEAAKGMSAIANNSALASSIDSLRSIIEKSAVTDAMRDVAAFHNTPAMESIRTQIRQLSEAMLPYQQMADILRPYSALQDAIRSATEDIPPLSEANDEDEDGANRSENNDGNNEVEDPIE